MKPNGIIDFYKFEAKDMLVAQKEGVANCKTTLRLKKDFTFKERNVCFGVTEIDGQYYLRNDTIYFVKINPGRKDRENLKFAVIEPKINSNSKTKLYLRIYKNLSEASEIELTILKNELYKLENKNLNDVRGF